MIDKENDREIRELLEQTLGPVKDTELRRDLWPQMLRKLDEQPGPARNVPWFDWALAAILSTALLLFPGTIPALLYHL
jgi:hypothetical protein